MTEPTKTPAMSAQGDEAPQRSSLQDLLDHCIAEARAEHGPKILDPSEIYSDLAKRLLTVILGE